MAGGRSVQLPLRIGTVPLGSTAGRQTCPPYLGSGQEEKWILKFKGTNQTDDLTSGWVQTSFQSTSARAWDAKMVSTDAIAAAKQAVANFIVRRKWTRAKIQVSGVVLTACLSVRSGVDEADTEPGN